MRILYETERIILALFNRELIQETNSNYLKWMFDKDVTKYNHWGLFPHSKAKEEAFLDMCESGESDLVLAVIAKDFKKHIGNLSLQRINWIYRSAEYAITIGDKNYWGKDYGYEASLLLFYHGFEKMNLHRIWTGTATTNEGMKKLAKKLSMFWEGKLQEAMFISGKYTDIEQYAILEQTWRKEELCQKAKNLMI